MDTEKYKGLIERLRTSNDSLSSEACQAIEKLLADNHLLNNSYERMGQEIGRLNYKNDRLLQELARKGKDMDTAKYKVGYTTGVYDMFHLGHLNILRRAKEQCDYLVVGVTTDNLCIKRKGKRPIICEGDRMEIVRAIRFVDEVILQESMDKLDIVRKIQADAVFVGSDWKGTPEWNKYEEEFASEGCTVVYLEHTEGISSTILRDRLNAGEQAL